MKKIMAIIVLVLSLCITGCTIKNENEFLISWDNYIFDSPVLDLYNLYKNEWEEVVFKDVFDEYNSNFELLEEEKLLFTILVSIPYKIENKENEDFL